MCLVLICDQLILPYNYLVHLMMMYICTHVKRVFANCRNKLCESEQLGYLGLCPKLVALQIHGNPFCSLLSTSIEVCHVYNFRYTRNVCFMLGDYNLCIFVYAACTYLRLYNVIHHTNRVWNNSQISLLVFTNPKI